MLRGVWLSDQHFWQLSLKPFEVRRCHVWMAWLLYYFWPPLPFSSKACGKKTFAAELRSLWASFIANNTQMCSALLGATTYKCTSCVKRLKNPGTKVSWPLTHSWWKTSTPYEKVYNFLGERSMNSTNIPTHKQIVLNYDYFPPHSSSFMHTYSK